MYKVTVGISCYKQKRWLHRCLRSLARQTLSKENFEIIIVNDDPEESLEDVCAPLKDYLNIRLIDNKKNLGLPSSLNKILSNALGKYFVRVDSDDYVSKDFLYVLSSFLEMNSGPRVLGTERNFQAVACDYFKVNDCGEILSRHLSSKEPIACGIMFSYESLCSVGFYNEEFKMREGHELLERYGTRYKLYNLPMPLYKYRMHSNNRTNDKSTVKKYDSKLISTTSRRK
jgi:glycosyltransferase involved in cell wall biosynthesis